MSIVPLLVFCSLLLAVFAVVLFLNSTARGDHEHADRLSLLPLEDDDPPAVANDETIDPQTDME